MSYTHLHSKRFNDTLDESKKIKKLKNQPLIIPVRRVKI